MSPAPAATAASSDPEEPRKKIDPFRADDSIEEREVEELIEEMWGEEMIEEGSETGEWADEGVEEGGEDGGEGHCCFDEEI
ncbi:MAG: hypothetical protein Q9162_002768 [Coniocarpon cinnabarinum]